MPPTDDATLAAPNGRPPSARQVLRRETRADHEAVDALFSRTDFADAADYGAFLTAQAAAQIGIETALERAGASTIVPDWASRRRAALIRADLAALDLPEPPMEPIALSEEASVWGALYVVEGSRLGGTLLARQVPARLPKSFLSAAEPILWRRLLTFLDERLRSNDELTVAVCAARLSFAAFRSSGRRVLGV